MTMVYCQTCSKDVHITADCVKRDDHTVTRTPTMMAPESENDVRQS